MKKKDHDRTNTSLDQSLIQSYNQKNTSKVKQKQLKADSKTKSKKILLQQLESFEISMKFSQSNALILQHVTRELLNRKIQLSPNITWKIDDGIIILEGPQTEVQLAEKRIYSRFQTLQADYFNQRLDLNDKEALFFIQNLSDKKQVIERKEDCIISIDTVDQSQIALSLNFQNKKFNIVLGDYKNFNSHAIINFTDSQLDIDQILSGNSKIANLIGLDYQIACEDYLKTHKLLKNNEVFVFESDHQQVKFILNIEEPPLKCRDHKLLNDLFFKLFQEADKLHIEEISLTLFDTEVGIGLYIDVVLILNAILDNLFINNSTVQKVNILENRHIDINRIVQLTNSIVNAPDLGRQIQFKWQWKDRNGFKDYEEDTNEQIDIAYEEFLKDNKKSEVKLKFPYNKNPGTHRVDLTNNELQDKDLQKITPIVWDQNSYLFDGNPIDPVLNELLCLKKDQGIVLFEIFYKCHKIVFSTSKIVQVNEATNYVRSVTKTALEQQRTNFFFGKQFDLKVFPLVSKTENSVSVELLDKNNYAQISEQIKSLIRSHLIKIKVEIPYLKEPYMSELLQFINKNSLEIQGQLKPNQSIDVIVFKNQVDKIRSLSTDDKVIRFPEAWSEQSQNLLKVLLKITDPEYVEISQLFDKHSAGTIHKIYRIQNQLLWENYVIARDKLLDYYEQQKIVLKPQEESMYTWHGVKSQHPKVIYDGQLKAFDTAYSQDGTYWGRAIYFARQADYSHDYSHTLLPNEEPGCDGKFVFLCCLITTGKTYLSPAPQQLKNPPNGYSCVSGVTNGSRVDVLYDMDVYRAYPAYEVIYE